MNCIKRPKDMTSKDDCPSAEGVQFDPGEEWRTTTNSPRKNEVAGPSRKRCTVVDVSGFGIKIQYFKEQNCIGT